MNAKQPKSNKYLMYFVAAFIAFYLCQQVLWTRFVNFGPGYITGGTFIYFSSPLIIDVVTEVYGYKVARQLLWCGLFSLLFLGLCIFVVFKMPSPPFWNNTIHAYNIALGEIPAISIFSAISIFLGQTINAYCISKWKILTQGRYFWVRSIGSSVAGDSTTVILSNIAILATGHISSHLFAFNIIPELVIMLCFTAIASIPAAWLAAAMKKAEHLDVYDIGINFNPFKINDQS